MPLFGGRKIFRRDGGECVKNERADMTVSSTTTTLSSLDARMKEGNSKRGDGCTNNVASPPTQLRKRGLQFDKQQHSSWTRIRSEENYVVQSKSATSASASAAAAATTATASTAKKTASASASQPATAPPLSSPAREIVMTEAEKQKLVFHCQQAQGSPTGLISGFTNVKELYEKIAECYDFTPDEILFCTLNTHKLDMSKLLGGQIGLDDFIFVHRKGRPKEIEIEKTEDALGLTITDNGTGYSFIKRIKEGSIIDRIEYIQVGDHIEKINEESMVGRRHFEVAKLLKEIPRNSLFTIRLVEPLKAGFCNIESRNSSRRGKKANYGTGKETLRFKGNGSIQIENAPNSIVQLGTESINQLLENFLGINDDELATQIWETAEGKLNSMEFADAIDNSDLEELGFTDDFIIELWGVITDARAGRLVRR